MRYKLAILFSLFALSGSAQIVKTAGIPYTVGAPTHTPSASGSAWAIDTGDLDLYAFYGGAWSLAGERIQTISGCTAPAYTPGKGQSVFVINGCDSLYYYRSGAWVIINAGGGGGGGGVSDGDKGDIDVSASGSVWTIDTSAVTRIKIAADAIDSTKIENLRISLSDIAGAWGVQNGSVLKWNGSNWRPSADNTGTDGNGIYSGDGDIPTNTDATLPTNSFLRFEWPSGNTAFIMDDFGDTVYLADPSLASSVLVSASKVGLRSTGNIELWGGTGGAKLRMLEPTGSGANYTQFQVGAQSADITYTLPATTGSNGQYLQFTTGGQLQWSTVAAGVTDGDKDDITVSGSGANWNIRNDSVTTSKILNGTILFEDIGQNSAGSGQVIKWNGSAWAAAADNTGGSGSTDLSWTGASSPYTLNSSSGTDVDFAQGGGITLSTSGATLTIAATDQSTTNELQTLSAATNTVTLSNSGGSFTIAGAGINTASTSGSTITITGTENDGSTTNELQTLSTATNTVTLSNSGGSFTIAGAGINTVSTSGSTITVTGTENDGSTTNELQTIANTSDATSHTVTLSNSGGSVQLIQGAGIDLTTGGNSGAGTVTIASTQVGVTDGDKGDIDVTATGATWTIDTGSVTTGKIANATILFEDVAQNGASIGQAIKWNGTAWAAAADTDTDAQTLSIDSSIVGSSERFAVAISGGNTVRFDVPQGTVTSVGITAPAAGITVASGSPVTTSGSITLALANDLAGIEGLTSTGIAVRTDNATSAWATRSLTAANPVFISTNSGVGGNPFIFLNAGDFGDVDITNSNIGSNLRGDIWTIDTGSINSVKIANSTILFEDIAANSAINGQVIKYNGSAWVAATDETGGGGVTDGDKGDITVSGSGATWTIDADVVDSTNVGNKTLSVDDLNGGWGAAAGTPLEWNGTNWRPGVDSSGIYSGSGNVPGITVSNVLGYFGFQYDTGDGEAFSVNNTGGATRISSPDANTYALVQNDSITIESDTKVKIVANTLDASGVTTFIGFPSGGGVTDGDKGDITVSASGATWTIDNTVVAYAKIQNVSNTNRILGRATAGAGSVEEITVGGDLTQSGSNFTVANDAITFAKMQNSAAAGLSVVGRSANSAGDFAEINATTDGFVLRRSGTTLGFGTVATAGIADNAVNFDKFQDITGNSVLARTATGDGSVNQVALSSSNLLGRGSTGNVSAITLGTNLSMSGSVLNTTGHPTITGTPTTNAIPKWTSASALGSTIVQESISGTDTIIQIVGRDALRLPLGTTAERPGTPTIGMTRYNTTNGAFEYYDADAWETPLLSATGTGLDTAGRVLFANANGRAAGSSNLFWDATNSRLGIGTNTPGRPIDIVAQDFSGIWRAFRAASTANQRTILSSFSVNNSETDPFSSSSSSHVLFANSNNTPNNYSQFQFSNAGGQFAAYLGCKYGNHASAINQVVSDFYIAVMDSAVVEMLTIKGDTRRAGINSTSPSNTLQIGGTLGRNAPTTVTGNYTVADGVTWLIVNNGASTTITLPAASSWTGRELTIKTIQAQTVISGSSNVVPIDSPTAGTAILPATDGAWALLVSDGTNWVIMQKG
jgi:hypothetical protein